MKKKKFNEIIDKCIASKCWECEWLMDNIDGSYQLQKECVFHIEPCHWRGEYKEPEE